MVFPFSSDAFLPREHICEGGLGRRNSVRLSHACIGTKLDDALQIFLYHTKGQSFRATLIPRVVGGRRPFPLKSALKVTHPLQKTPTSTDFRL